MLRIGLVNNMVDGALEATDRQFAGLVEEGGGGRAELVRFFISDVPRSAEAMAFLGQAYLDAALIPEARLDGLIVTGRMPLTPDLRQETHWDAFRRLADWADAVACPTIWSCLAAHAAVLHFDGVERRLLEQKCSGVFRLSGRVASGRCFAPHSRLNTLDEPDLLRAGYRLLRIADGAGVDAFERGRFLFLQGHPEYDLDTLRSEYRRDVKRFLRGERPELPQPPANYFDPETQARLAELEAGLARQTPDAAAARLDAILSGARLEPVWRPAAVELYAGWLESIAPLSGAQLAHA